MQSKRYIQCIHTIDMRIKQEWFKQLNTVHKFNAEETQVMKEAYIIKQDPRFSGNWDQALSLAYDLHFDQVESDPDAMRVRN